MPALSCANLCPLVCPRLPALISAARLACDAEMECVQRVQCAACWPTEGAPSNLSLQEPQSIVDALAILGDTHNRRLPIYRSGEDGVATLATAVFNLKVWLLRRRHAVIALLMPGVQCTVSCYDPGAPAAGKSCLCFPWQPKAGTKDGRLLMGTRYTRQSESSSSLLNK